MNAQTQIALETLKSKLIATGHKGTAANVSAKFAISEEKGIQFVKKLIEVQSDSISESLRSAAVLFQDFLNVAFPPADMYEGSEDIENDASFAAMLVEIETIETEESFIAEALEIKVAATELSSEEYKEARRFETALLYGEIHAMCELVAGASNTDKVKRWVLGGDMSKGAVKDAGLVEQFGAYVRLTPKGMKIAKYFTGALA